MKILKRFGIHSGILFLIVLLFSPSIRAQKPAADDLLVLTNVTIVDVRTGALQPEQTVVLERNHIASVGPSKSAKYPRNAPSVNCRGLFLIPGLWDMHVHLVFGDWFPGAKDISLPLFAANGVTGVRDMGSELDIVQGWRDEIEAGRLIGPRIYTSGPMLDGRKPRFPSSLAIGTPEDAHRAVADLKRRGADFIKLQSLIPREAVFAIAEEAKKQEIAFEGHVPDAARASEMSAAGMKYVPASWKNKTWKRFTDEITQGYGADDLAIRKRFVEKELEVVGMLHQAGVLFLAGTDTPAGVHIFPGYSLYEELRRFVAAGFTPLEALQTATLNPARFFGIEEQIGAVEKGKLADLVLLSANPLEDIANTQKIAAVIVNGQYYRRADLEKMLGRLETAARRQP